VHLRIAILLLLFSASCVAYQMPTTVTAIAEPEEGVVYASTDLRFVSIFSKQGARLNAPLFFSGIRPSSPARYFETSDSVQCVSIGSTEKTVEYAIKRPIKAGEQYSCLETNFKVVRCFEDCRAAVVEIGTPLIGANSDDVYRVQMYVDRCLGVLILNHYSQNGNLTEAIPLDAQLLRGQVGILANKNYPDCVIRP